MTDPTPLLPLVVGAVMVLAPLVAVLWLQKAAPPTAQPSPPIEAMERLATAFRAVAQQIGSALLPVLEKASDALGDLAAAFDTREVPDE